MELDQDRDVLQKEIEKTTAPASSVPVLNSENTKKVGVGVRTYAADIAEIMRREKGSVIKIALAEQERRHENTEKHDPTSTKNLIVVFIGLIFIIGGILIFVYFLVNRNTGVSIAPPVTSASLVYSENQTQIDLSATTRGTLFTAIHSNLTGEFAENGTITNLLITTPTSVGRNPATIQSVFTKLGIKPPESILNLISPNFMLGVYEKDEVGNMFLIFRVSDFNQSFAAMKEWEVSFANDFVRLFRIDAKSFNGDIFTEEFKSDVIYNKQARNLFDKDGRLVISYIYIDSNTIIITTNTELVDEVIKRINSQSIK
ncbi:MAG: hypothetical protein QG551_31 [Patescibacteria group bacterium]|nr:hypothetical protein [Patescibacteria group bacterium]